MTRFPFIIRKIFIGGIVVGILITQIETKGASNEYKGEGSIIKFGFDHVAEHKETGIFETVEAHHRKNLEPWKSFAMAGVASTVIAPRPQKDIRK